MLLSAKTPSMDIDAFIIKGYIVYKWNVRREKKSEARALYLIPSLERKRAPQGK